MALKKLVATGFLLLSPMTYACSCAKISSNDNFDEYKFIFAGKMTGKNSFLSFGKTKYKFEVTHLYQGPNQKEVTLWAGKFGWSCGANFERGVDYLVMVSESDGKLSTGLCNYWERSDAHNSNTRVIEEYFVDKEAH